MSHKATLFTRIKENIVKCTACRQYCVIAPGNTGICGVRQNKSGTLELLVYGTAVAANIDPIEKKPLFHFKPGTQVFSIGTVGCNFACSFCQNWDISQAAQEFRKKLATEGKMDELETNVTEYGYTLPPEKIIAFCKENHIPSIAFTYNEPSIFFEYTYDTAKLAQKEGISTVYVSNGYASEEAVDTIAPYLDAINIDLKAFTEKFYKKNCQAKLQPVLDSIKYYHKKDIWLEVTTLIIPEENDSSEELTHIAEFIVSVSKDIPWHVTAFSPAYKMQNKHSTSAQKLQEAYSIGKKSGLKFVYAGNIRSEDLHSTYCPQCGTRIIQRDWGYARTEKLQNGKCTRCGTEIAGVWAN